MVMFEAAIAYLCKHIRDIVFRRRLCMCLGISSGGGAEGLLPFSYEIFQCAQTALFTNVPLCEVASAFCSCRYVILNGLHFEVAAELFARP